MTRQVLRNDTFHQSGKFNAKIPQKALMLDHAFAQSQSGVVTEGVGLDIPSRFKNWHMVGHETKVFWSDLRFKEIDHEQLVVRTPDWKRGTLDKDSVEFMYACLEDKQHGLRLLRVGGHLPAHLYKPSQRRANIAALHGLEPALRPLIGDLKPDKIIISCDFNRELRLKKNRELIEHAVHGLGLRLIVPPKATHGRLHVIDGALADYGHASMLDWVNGYDHRGFVVHSDIRGHSVTH